MDLDSGLRRRVENATCGPDRERHDGCHRDENANIIQNDVRDIVQDDRPHEIATFPAGNDIRRKVKALLSSDLNRLPDVQQLIKEHWYKVENTSHLLLNKLIRTSDKVRAALLQIPQLRNLILEHLREHPEWANYILPMLKEGVDPVEAISKAIVEQPELTLPEFITRKLAMIPDVHQIVLDVEKFGSDVLSSLELNMHRLRDLQSLVQTNLARLPTLQTLLEEHHLSSRPLLKQFESSPHWMRDNEYILSGYRPELFSFQRCLESMFYWHNETGNIWTHVLGGVFFLILSFYGGNYILHKHDWMDQLLFFMFWSTAITCLLCSAVFHTMFCHSYEMHIKFSKLDYIGIVVLIVGSVIAVLYFAFYCHPLLRSAYITVTSTFGLLAGYVTLSPVFDGNDKKHIRVIVFIALAGTSLLPSLHYSALVGFEEFFRTYDVFWLFGVSVPLYLGGAALYVFKFPECLFPGTFDYLFHSHQLWHICVMAAAYAHYLCVLNMSHYRRDVPCPA